MDKDEKQTLVRQESSHQVMHTQNNNNIITTPTTTDISTLYHGQTHLFGQQTNDDILNEISEIIPNLKISKILLFDIPKLSNWINSIKLIKNRFIRTKLGNATHQQYNQLVTDDQLIQIDIIRKTINEEGIFLRRAGPRSNIIWNRYNIKAAIVTCGGLCPGINDCVVELVNSLYYNYGVDTIYGIKWGYRGFYQEDCLPYLNLNPSSVDDLGVRVEGGSILGSSRGGNDPIRIIDACILNGINQIYAIGGDGTHRGAQVIYNEIKKRKLKISIVCLPKTVDNDIGIIDVSFGFNTAIEESEKAIISARTEARCTPNGIGIVKLMGRNAGFIAQYSALAAREVDLVLIPEIPFELYGKNGILLHLEKTIKKQGFAVVVVAEGAGQHLLPCTGEVDGSGNPKFPPIGIWLQDEIKKYFKQLNIPFSVKYNDPNYMIRSGIACTHDTTLCLIMSQNAVHGAMAGYTGFSSCMVNSRSVMIPISVLAECSPVHINTQGKMWERVLLTTQQPM